VHLNVKDAIAASLHLPICSIYIYIASPLSSLFGDTTH